jgi:hypothetical protein
MYGSTDKAVAISKAAELRYRDAVNRYEVHAHSYSDSWLTGKQSVPLTWGVVRYVPYCDAMPWRCAGFVRF